MEIPRIFKNIGFKIDFSEDDSVSFSGDAKLDQVLIDPYLKFSLQDLLNQKIKKVFMGFCIGIPIKNDFIQKADALNSAVTCYKRKLMEEDSLEAKMLGVLKGKFEWDLGSFELTSSQVEFEGSAKYVFGCKSLKEPFSSSYVKMSAPLILQLPSVVPLLTDPAIVNSRYVPLKVSINIKPGSLFSSAFEIDLFKNIENEFIALGSVKGKVADPKDLTFQLALQNLGENIITKSFQSKLDQNEVFDLKNMNCQLALLNSAKSGLGNYDVSIQIKTKDLKDLQLKSSVTLGENGCLTSSFSSAIIFEKVEDVLKTYQQAKSKKDLEKNLEIFKSLINLLKTKNPLDTNFLQKTLEIAPLLDTLTGNPSSGSNENKAQNTEKVLRFILDNRNEILLLINAHETNLRVLGILALMEQSLEESLQSYILKNPQRSQEDESLKSKIEESFQDFQQMYKLCQEGEKYILKEKPLAYLQMMAQILFLMSNS